MRRKDWLATVIVALIVAGAFIFSPGNAGSAAAQGCRMPPRGVQDLMCHLPAPQCGPGLICLDALTILIIVLCLVGVGFLWFLLDLLCSRCRQPVLEKLDALKTGIDAVKADTGKIAGIAAAVGKLEESCKKLGEAVGEVDKKLGAVGKTVGQIDGKLDALADDTTKIIKKIKHRLPKRHGFCSSYYSSSSCCTVSRSRDGRSNPLERRVERIEDRFDRLEHRIELGFDQIKEMIASKKP